MRLSPTTKAAMYGGMAGVAVVTGLAIFLKIRELQTAERQAQIEAEVSATAETAALDYLATRWGLTQQRIDAISTFARRFETH